ncbi:MAG: IS1595 family transposase [Reyranellaceae bacterium]
MSQHFLLSAKARSLSLAKVMRLTDEEAYETFKAIRWADTEGKPFCGKCGGTVVYEYAARRIFKCKGCTAQFSVTSGTIFASRKMPVRDLLAAIAIFVNGAKGHSALQLSRDLDCQYKTAFVLAHKLREAMGAADKGAKVAGHVEIDGMYVGGHVRPANYKKDRKDRRLAENQTGKRQVVIVARERDGKTLTLVAKTEADAVRPLHDRLAHGTTVYADEASHWDAFHARYVTKRINHTVAYSHDGACTNQAESFFSRLRRAEIGIHHKIAGPYLAAYAAEMDWREDNRRVANGEQYQMVIKAALAHPASRQWAGYWQRSNEWQNRTSSQH